MRLHDRLATRAERHLVASVLIVDDDLDVAELSKMIFEAAGHHIRVGHTGLEGLKSLDANPLPDCVVLDVDMPVLNGPEMAHEMLLHDAGEEKIPIVLVSARNDLTAVAARMGTPYFVAKATEDYVESLLEMLERALRERRPPAAA